jgi:hypothetical protein
MIKQKNRTKRIFSSRIQTITKKKNSNVKVLDQNVELFEVLNLFFQYNFQLLHA